MYMIAIVGWFTFYSYTYLSLEQVNFYEEYLGPLEDQRQYQSDA